MSRRSNGRRPHSPQRQVRLLRRSPPTPPTDPTPTRRHKASSALMVNPFIHLRDQALSQTSAHIWVMHSKGLLSNPASPEQKGRGHPRSFPVLLLSARPAVHLHPRSVWPSSPVFSSKGECVCGGEGEEGAAFLAIWTLGWITG